MFWNLILISVATYLFVSVESHLVVHEWGTYTSCQGSNGVSLPGLHHGESDLPDFVHSRADTFTHAMWRKVKQDLASKNLVQDQRRGIIPPVFTATTPRDCGFCEVMDWIPTAGTQFEVTQKLETPVVYFYSDERIENLQLTVDFPKGIVTEVYPQAEVNMPDIGKVEATAGGHAEWNVTVHSKHEAITVPFVESSNIWAPSRRVTANFVSTTSAFKPRHSTIATPKSKEYEHHIFYRGLGAWEGPLKVTSTSNELTIQNVGSLLIPAAWVMASDGKEGGLVYKLPSIQAGASVRVPLDIDGRITVNSSNPKFMEMDLYLDSASVLVEVELIKAGLFPLEARAMVNTWAKSYFQSFGTRVLYISPSAYPHQLLPWKISEKVDDEKRVFVGRVEIILQTEEQNLRTRVERLLAGNHTHEDESAVKALGRFAEAKIRRVLNVLDANNQNLEKWILDELTY